MQLIVLIAMIVGLTWVAVRAGLRLSDRTLVMLVRGFAGWRGYSSPSGVQEEDRDSRWGRPAVMPNEPPPARASLGRVKPAVHAR